MLMARTHLTSRALASKVEKRKAATHHVVFHMIVPLLFVAVLVSKHLNTFLCASDYVQHVSSPVGPDCLAECVCGGCVAIFVLERLRPY